MRKIVFAWTMALLAVAIQAQDHAAAEAALKAQQYEKAAAAYQKITVANTALLELAGLGAPKKVDVRTTHYTANEIDALKQRGLEAARAAGILPTPPVEAELLPLASNACAEGASSRSSSAG